MASEEFRHIEQNGRTCAYRVCANGKRILAHPFHEFKANDFKYQCLSDSCDSSDVILCEGDLIKKYFRHNIRKNCGAFFCSESSMHKTAKYILAHWLKEKPPRLEIEVKCLKCPEKQFPIVKFAEYEGCNVKEEYNFSDNFRADVDVYDNLGNTYCLFEVYQTHKTAESTRPNNIPWYELDAADIIQVFEQDEMEYLKNIARPQKLGLLKCRPHTSRRQYKIDFFSNKKQNDFRSSERSLWSVLGRQYCRA